ncbi:MAG: hypothetical protein KY397_03265 [Gemmatimonadetes bacterium]|nr:hypothetical protein [Gemmatimonadota bacterium]
MRTPFRVSRYVLTLGLAILSGAIMAAPATAQDASGSTYRVILYIAEEGAPAEMSLRRLEEVWTADQGTERLRQLLGAGSIQRLEDVRIEPGREGPALKVGNVTVRVKGAYREPRRDAMFLRVEVEGGRDTLVKEMLSKFDETILLAYPLAEGDRSVVALIIPAQVP